MCIRDRSNVGLIAAFLLLFGLDWLYMHWGSGDVPAVKIAWSKLLFILIGANVIVFFTYINRSTGRSEDNPKDR